MKWMVKPVNGIDEANGCFCLIVICYTKCDCNNPDHTCDWIYSCNYIPPICNSDLCAEVCGDYIRW